MRAIRHTRRSLRTTHVVVGMEVGSEHDQPA